MEIPLMIFNPTKAVAVIIELKFPDRFQIITEILIHLFKEPISTMGINGVFETCMFAVGSIPKITLHHDNLLRNIDNLVRSDKSDGISQTRISLGHTVCHSHSTSDGDIVTDNFSIFDNRHERQIICVNVDIIGWRHGYRDFKFTREIGLPVNRLYFLRC